ncbi:MAG: hypothetical protein LBN41_09500 [Enterobacteriaceae bacterium]|jgi:uncharacterized protein YcfL|nr:hypothetical protein [Enterobacteriaceae bacterium]
MKKIIAVSLLSLFALAGCNSSPTVGNWYKDNVSAQEAEKDRIQCEAESKSSAINVNLQHDPVGVVDTDQVIDNTLIHEQQQIDLIWECMRAKGYNSN